MVDKKGVGVGVCVLNCGSIMAAAIIFTGDEEVSCVAGDGAEIEHGGAGDAGLGGGGVARVEGPAFEDGLVVVRGEGGDVEGVGEGGRSTTGGGGVG